MTNLEQAKKVIEEQIEHAECGLFNSRNYVGDRMKNIFNNGELQIDICYDYGYFEVFGLTDDEFNELGDFYKSLVVDY